MLYEDVTWLHGYWSIYRQLFGMNKERLDLLINTASSFAEIVHASLLDNVQLRLARIGEGAGAGQQKNVTLRRLQAELEDASEREAAQAMGPLLERFERACRGLRKRRNKLIAHTDVSSRQAVMESRLPGPSRQESENALAILREIMNLVEFHYARSKTSYDNFVMDADGEHLITALAKAERYQQLVKEGIVPLDDLRRNLPRGL
ncbi:hypothetical protein CKO31_10720 [Thiohalocapsa halophila]|uniref:HEPN AbiU2-like domain-containing protein n=1 Tax=Thiohalocapsa halophila TaxID=69359 RepID=A0ABS1CH07_9GAMM|nr:hypothetical protein [Thiohalocapsa halophila]MBK1631202.1 hypothetical protein [Thiohalocapsa halophila]